MNISTLKIAWKYLTGGVGSVASYLLDILNNALACVSAGNKTKIQAVLNIAQKVLSTLLALKWLCPTKWQSAYSDTVEAVSYITGALSDFNITDEELLKVRNQFRVAWNKWESDDDETCVDCFED